MPCSDRQKLGYHPEMVLAGRRLDGNMPIQFAVQIVKLMNRKRIHANGACALMRGVTVKENCPDVRNSKTIDVAHEQFRSPGAEIIHRLCRKNHELYEIKHVFPATKVDARLCGASAQRVSQPRARTVASA